MSCAVGNWGFACCRDRSTAVRWLTWNISIGAPVVVPRSIHPLGMKLVFSSVFTECQQWCLSPGLVTTCWHATGVNWGCGGLKEASVFQRKSRVWSSACGGFSEPWTSTEKQPQLVGTGLDSSQPEFQARVSLGWLDTGCDGSGGQRGRGIPPPPLLLSRFNDARHPPPGGAGPSRASRKSTAKTAPCRGGRAEVYHWGYHLIALQNFGLLFSDRPLTSNLSTSVSS